MPTARPCTTSPPSHSSRRRCSSRSSALAMLVVAREPVASQAFAGAGEPRASGELVQAPRPRRGAHGGRGRPLARRRGAGDRRGRPARRDPDRQGDGRDPVAVRRHGAEDPRGRGRDRTRRHRARRDRPAGRGGARDRFDAPQPCASQAAAAPVADAGRVQATPVVRRIAQELGVDLAEVAGSGPGRAHHGGRRASVRGRERRRPTRAAARRPPRDRRAHGPRASRGATRDLGGGVRLRGRSARAPPPDGREGVRRRARRVPGAERALRRRRDPLPRPLRHRSRRADRRRSRGAGRPAGEREVGRRARDGDRRARRARSHGIARGRRPSWLHVHRVERGQARRALPDADRQPSGGRDPEHRPRRSACGRARRRDRRSTHRSTRDHLRPSRRRRRACGGVRPRGDRARAIRRACARRSFLLVPTIKEGERCVARIVGLVFVLGLVAWTFAYVDRTDRRTSSELAGCDALPQARPRRRRRAGERVAGSGAGELQAVGGRREPVVQAERREHRERRSGAHPHGASGRQRHRSSPGCIRASPPSRLSPGRSSGTLGEGTITAANLIGPLAGQPLSARR